MMRWLKEKKREKKSTSSWDGEDGKEDDYGFDKEKQASKSPSTRRQLPPTPATPEEKSPHIYEEIPDLPFSCSTDGEKALLQSKFNKRRNGATPNTYSQPKKNASNDDINPYMVVPVDKEVCQTPTHFHRNGTPEVHCDVIVKDTHCEILLTRKPKVGNFRLGSAALTGDPEGSIQQGVRNNTHYCSRDRRASVDVHTSGKQSRMNCLGAPSTQSMPNFSDLAAHVIEENNNGDSTGSGIVTYTSASNFIPRSTNLTFHPLGGKDPKKEAFGSDCSDDSNSGAFTSRRDENLSADTNGVSYASVQDICSASKCVTYASLLEQTQAGHGGSNIPNLTQDKSITDSSLYRFSDHLATISKLQPGNSTSSANDLCGVRAGIIQSPSPSNASCTYASVTFPAEPKLYNTIPDLIPSDFTDAGHSHLESEAISGVIYSRVSETFGTEANFQITGDHCDKKSAKHSVYPAMTSYTRSESSIIRTSLGAPSNSALCRNRSGSNFKSSIYSGVMAPENNQNPYNSIESDTLQRRSSLFPSSTGACRRSIDLDFCSCSDEHSSSCGCTEAKMDEDLTSLAGAVGEGQNNCKGRLIRQITYSESYSDETYEHVYSSRLLIRNGRRFSSPDITCLEASNSELRFLHHSRSPEFNVSRDDTWASSRSDDLIPPAYGACDDNLFVSNYSEITSLKRRDSDLSEYRLSPRMYQGSLVNSRVFLRQNTSPVSSETSMFCGMRAAVSTSSVFSTGPTVISDLHLKSKTQYKDAKLLKSGATSETTTCTTSKNTTKDNLQSGTTKSKYSISDSTETKPNTFSGIFSKFSRTKPPKPTKSSRTESVEPLETKPVNQSIANEQNVQIENRQKDFEIPEKNVKKLSKFFQRLSSKDSVKPSVENTIEFSSSEAMNMNRQSSPTEINQGSKLDLPKKPSISDFQCISGQCHNQNLIPDVYQGRSFTEDSTNPKTSPAVGSEAWSVLTVSADIHPDPGNDAGPDGVAGSKPQTNTDSGDTCYEYDISTSSEGEQANYDYFLSKVKKTLNLEHEVQHIAAANIARRRHLCKKCKKDDSAMNDCLTSSSSDGEENVCPHLAAKFGDLRDIIHDLVVDQRAAILDCLTDFAHSPYNLKNNGPEAHCRKCGCELMTSDSESLTTVYSLLSQQLSVASPSGQTQSCESDEGTMADNSCESADEGCVENGDIPFDAGIDCGSHICPDTGFSKAERGAHKNKKREKKEKKTVLLNAYSGSEKEQTRAHKTATGHGISQTHSNSPHKDRHPGSSECKANSSKDGGRNTFALNTRRNTPKKSSFFPAYTDTQPSTPHALLGSMLADDQIDHLKMCAVSRSKPGTLSDKALQDIYAPLPSKALSLLTSRNYGTHTGVSCTCGREKDPSSAIMASHIKTGEPSLPPAGAIKEGQSLKSSPSCPSLLQEHNSDGVFPVQAHLDTFMEKRELSAVKGRKEADIRRAELGKSSVGNGKELASETSRGKTMNIIAPPHPSGANDGVFTAKIYEIVSPYPEKSSMGGAGLENINSNTRRGFSNEFTTNWVAFNSNRVPVAHSIGEYDYTSHKHSENARAIPSITNHDRDSTRPDSAEVTKTKFKLTRKHRLELASLDLLPETALRGDDEGVAVEEKRQPTVRTKRSKVVERMAKIFESRHLNEGSASNTSHKFGEPGKAVAVKNRSEKSKYSENVTYETMRNIGCVEDSSVRSNEVVIARLAGTLKADQAEMLAKHTKVYTASESSPNLARGGALSGRCSVKSRDLDEALTSADTSDLLLATSKTQTSAGRSKGDKEKVVKPRRSHSEDKLRASDCKLLHELKGSKSKSFVSSRRSTETNKIASPTPSLSSSSSSSLTKKKTSSHARHKKMSRKTYKKRSKSRSERSRSCGREERTFYYLSSDLSDIDVVEVADWETYATKLAPSPKSIHASHDPKQKFTKSDDVGASDSPSTSGVLMNDERYNQEVYSIPPSSSELRQARDKGEATSPQASPELPKPRKNKRTDVYKTRRSNNKLLSDLIIRNYDMQIYGNI